MKDIENLIQECRDKFTAMPNVVYEMGLSCQELALLGAIRRSAGDSGVCTRSTKTLAFNAGMGTASVSRAKHALEERGLIDITLADGDRGRPRHVIKMNPLLWIANDAYFLLPADQRPEAPLCLSWRTGLALTHPAELLFPVGEPQSSEVEPESSEVELIRSTVEPRKNHEEEPIKEKPTVSKSKIQKGKSKKKQETPPEVVGLNLTEIEYMDITASRPSGSLYYVLFVPRYMVRYTCSSCGEENEWPTSETKRRKLSTRTCEACGTKHMIHGVKGNGDPAAYGSGKELDALWEVHIPGMPVLMSRVDADSATLEEFFCRWQEDMVGLISCANYLVEQEVFFTKKRGQHLGYLLNSHAKRARTIASKKETDKDGAYSPPKEVVEEEDDWDILM